MQADYVIIGAGSAGCVLANRLSANPRNRVVLLEAGPASRSPWLSIPAGMKTLFIHPTLNWRYFTEPEPHLDNRRLYWPRGKTLGGSSAINGMGYVRGHPADYDHWRQLGNEGWSWDDVLPVYRSIERYENGDPAWHGTDGSLAVSEARTKHPVSQAFVAAAHASGLAETRDFNTDRQEGSGFYRFSINRGLRHSSAHAFLDPVRDRDNLTIITEAQTERIIIEDRRAAGVVYSRAGERREIRSGEVIVAAGAVNSPQLLMLSGIGPGPEIARHGIPVIHELPGVGGNLQDHLYIHHLVQTRKGYSSNASMQGLGAVLQAIDFAVRRRGILALGASQSGAFARSHEALDRPDLQFMFKAYSLNFNSDGTASPSKEPGVTTSISQVRPLSRGRITLADADPRTPPSIFANYLSEDADKAAMVAGLRWARRIFSHPPLDGIAVAEVAPGSRSQTDDELLCFIRAMAQSMYHPVGTCMMGHGAAAVVDNRLRVHGIERLRVADASIMPTIIAGNTNAPSMMIGARAAEIIEADSR